MNYNLLRTGINNHSALISRVTLAAVILPHGLQKMLGILGGYGIHGTMTYFTDTLGLPWIVGVLVILAESGGAIVLAAGLLSRFVAGSLLLVMSGAASTHLQNGFFMNWFGTQTGEGIEFFILAIALAIHVIIDGGGKWSTDGWLAKRMDEKNKLASNQKFETSF